jgi:hypothetical protein
MHNIFVNFSGEFTRLRAGMCRRGKVGEGAAREFFWELVRYTRNFLKVRGGRDLPIGMRVYYIILYFRFELHLYVF